MKDVSVPGLRPYHRKKLKLDLLLWIWVDMKDVLARALRSYHQKKIEVGLTFMGYPAKKYPNNKKPYEFTDYLFGGAYGVPDGPGHGHAIIQNSTGNIVMLREPNSNQPIIWDTSICP